MARTRTGTWPPLPALREWTGQMPNETTAYCPECSCWKSNDVDQPNGVSESCSDERCRCHDEDAT